MTKIINERLQEEPGIIVTDHDLNTRSEGSIYEMRSSVITYWSMNVCIVNDEFS